jgi:hypothetical protein
MDVDDHLLAFVHGSIAVASFSIAFALPQQTAQMNISVACTSVSSD